MKSHVHVSTFSSLKFGRRLYCVRLRPVLSLFLSVSSIDIHKNFKHAEPFLWARAEVQYAVAKKLFAFDKQIVG